QQQQQQPPTPAQQVAVGQVDRYCSDCDIRFSSTKTYRAHKQHYCSSRHREGHQSNNSTPKPAAAQKSGSQSPPDVPKTPPVSAAQQPFLALPTNPIIVIPYSLIRGASVIPGLLSSLAPGIANPESACFIFQNGALQPIAMSLASHVQAVTMAAATGPTGLEGLGGPGQHPQQQQQQQQQLLVSSRSSASNNQLQQQQQSRGPTPSVSNENSSHSTAGGGGASATGEVLKAINKRDNTANK
uniref:Uncharacterized protein n=1 Tax=Anopheles atroparvus TaxID=41427 RepID=A0A182J9U3_ANOAO